MDTKRNNTILEGFSEEPTPVSLKGIRGANRYNNGATKYGRKYLLRITIGWAAQQKLKEKTGDR